MPKPRWRFPPRNGGIDYVNDPSGAHFSDAPIPKLVREWVRNALDARHDGLSEPVIVTFTETNVKRSLIGAASLQKHLQACLDRANGDARPDRVEVYTRALSVIGQRNIPCLKVQDTGTMGLNDARWKALVVQEGAVSKGNGAPDGSYGIGKNAILNVSDLQTVFHGTRLVERRKGLVTKLQGKATLTGHPDPNGVDDDLQHMGFHCLRDGPVMGRDIPEFFQLEKTGTGVFIMGFNPHSSDRVDEIATAAIENFVHAVHHRNLIVEVKPADGSPVRMDLGPSTACSSVSSRSTATPSTTTGPSGTYRRTKSRQRSGSETWAGSGCLFCSVKALPAGLLTSIATACWSPTAGNRRPIPSHQEEEACGRTSRA